MEALHWPFNWHNFSTPSWCLGINLAVSWVTPFLMAQDWGTGADRLLKENAGPSRDGNRGALLLTTGTAFHQVLLCPFIHAHLPHRRCECPSVKHLGKTS